MTIIDFITTWVDENDLPCLKKDIQQRRLLMIEKFHPIRPLGSLYTLAHNDDIIFNAIRGQREKVVCVNDSESVDNFEQTKNELINSFASILPDKSSFEL